MSLPGDPIEGDVLVLVAAKASVAPERLAPLVDTVQAHLEDDAAAFQRRYECAYETDGEAAFFVDDGFWETVGTDLGLDGNLIEDGDIRDMLTILKNGREVVHLDGLATVLEDGDTLSVFPPVAGG